MCGLKKGWIKEFSDGVAILKRIGNSWIAERVYEGLYMESRPEGQL